MIRKWLEEWFDTLLYLGLVMGALLFFLCYWKGEYQLRHAEIVLQDFLTEVSISGKITREEYEEMVRNLGKINADYDVSVVCTEYMLQPVYSLIAKEKIESYYMGRNVKRKKYIQPYEVDFNESAELLCFQEETNASILAAEQQTYLPLPEDGVVWSAEAVRPVQEVYEGENIITLCLVNSPEGSYYLEAAPMTAEASGIMLLELSVGEDVYCLPVEVQCYPRKLVCENGHEFLNSKEKVLEMKQTGYSTCPYCVMLPEQISCNISLLQKETGTKLTKEDIWIEAAYLDGHTEQVTPESEEWQDSYDENFCGIQQVTISYRGKEDAVTVLSQNKRCQQCNNACNDRCYADYILFPYCTECMSGVPLFTGEVYQEEQITAGNELVALLDIEGEVYLQRGDYITVYLKEKEKYASLLQKEIKRDGRYR